MRQSAFSLKLRSTEWIDATREEPKAMFLLRARSERKKGAP
jgi:hypothetical protein